MIPISQSLHHLSNPSSTSSLHHHHHPSISNISNITSGSDDLLLSSLDLDDLNHLNLDDLNHLDLARSDLHLALTIWISVHLHSRWSGLVLVLRSGGFGFGDCGGGGGGGGGGLKGCLGFLGFLG
ncbi:hypothetical protein Q3G72_026551 [Acer saccharum]|nr:hypothetical protein Q3G72_026551 [Acer saccharum]